jgi:hypothetical protein
MSRDRRRRLKLEEDGSSFRRLNLNIVGILFGGYVLTVFSHAVDATGLLSTFCYLEDFAD